MSNNNINQMNLENRQPLKLLKNRSYPTYQLYATVSSKQNPEQAMIIAVLETMSWLRKRFRELEVPDEIKFSEPDEFENASLDDFKSFRINEGYVVDVVFIKKKNIWALHLIEPDLGPAPGDEKQSREPIPGRVFETNIAYRIYNNRLECGFKTVCSETLDTKAVCEVYSLAVVKSIANNSNLGLEQVLPIKREPHLIDSYDRADRIIDYIKNNERQLPFVLIVEFKRDIKIEKLNIAYPGFDVNSLVNRSIEELMAATSDVEEAENEGSIEEKLIVLARSRMGYAQFAYLPSKYVGYFNERVSNCKLSNGDIQVFYPERFKSLCKNYNYDYIVRNKDNFIKDLEDELQEYPKYKDIDFGNVKFINDARVEELQSIIEIGNSKEEIVIAYESKINSILSENESTVINLKSIIQDKEAKIIRLNEQIEKLENRIDDKDEMIEEINVAFSRKVNKYEYELGRRDVMLARPRKTEEVPDWVDKYFADKLIFHDRARAEIKDTLTKDINMDLLCNAIEYLANEYRDQLIGKINEDERNKACSERYNRLFEVGPSGEANIKNFGTDYKVKYKIGFKGKLIEVPLDLHLKVGNDKLHLIRIYFYYDNENKLIVVGSLPKHLKTMSEKWCSVWKMKDFNKRFFQLRF